MKKTYYTTTWLVSLNFPSATDGILWNDPVPTETSEIWMEWKVPVLDFPWHCMRCLESCLSWWMRDKRTPKDVCGEARSHPYHCLSCVRLRVVPHFSSGIVEWAKREATREATRGWEREKWETTDKAQAFELMRCSHSAKLWLALPWKSVKNAPGAINTWHNHNLQNK